MQQEHEKIARLFEQQLSLSGQFHYSLQGVQRDESIDAVEDFVSNHPSGHCEYFATALAMMLRSQGIPSRVVTGLSLRRVGPAGRVLPSAAIARPRLGRGLSRSTASSAVAPPRRSAAVVLAAAGCGWTERPATTWARPPPTARRWARWEARWHSFQHYWEHYIADMDNKKQQESVYEPIQRALSEFDRRPVQLERLARDFAGAWDALARTAG